MNLNNNLTELSKNELLEINAGESGWYWVMYGVGKVVKAIGDAYQTAYGQGGNHYHSAG